MSAPGRRRRVVLLGLCTSALIGCSALLGLGDLHDRDGSCTEGCDGGGDVGTGGDSASSSDVAVEAGVDAGNIDSGDPCEFVKVTDPSVTTNPDYAAWPMPNLHTVNVAKYTVVNDVVHDEITKLDWQKAPAPGPDYLPDGGADYCATLPSDVPGLSWRMPTRIELVSILQYKNLTGASLDPPCIDDNSFTPGADPYPPKFLTSTGEAGGTTKGWVVNLGTCGASTAFVYSWVRCVRGAPSVPDFRVSTKCNVVRDMNARLDWQRDIAALPSPIQDGTTNYAANYCSDLPTRRPEMGAGWIMPTQKELYAMIDTSTVNPPRVSAVLFPGTPGSGKIISSTLTAPMNYGGLQLSSGDESGASFSAGAAVRCVRHF